jgi:ornithine carbamoyltransferase
MYMLFEKTSTRTALSFALGMQELGGRYFLQNWEDSNFTLGAIEDEVRYVARNVDVIMVRLKHHADIARMAEWSPVPVINGCCDRYHPCQGLADLLTLRELFGTLQVRVLYIGVLNNVFNALAGSLPRLGGELLALTPIVNEASLDEELLAAAKTTGRLRQLEVSEMNPAAFRALVRQVDVVYTDTWVDMEFFHNPAYAAEKERRLGLMMPFQLNEALLDGCSCRVMHDMPMHPGVEITRGVIEAHMGTILQQAENRRHAQKGVLVAMADEWKGGRVEV